MQRPASANTIVLALETASRTQFLDITEKVRRAVRESGATDGVCVVYSPHTTGGITINEHADPDVVHDMGRMLDRIVPWQAGYEHVEGNSAAHIKTGMTGVSQTVIIEGGKLLLGTWQGIFFAEFDGPRRREVWVKVMKG